MIMEDSEFIWRVQRGNKDESVDLTIISPSGDDEIIIKFVCDRCGEWVYGTLTSPIPDLGSDHDTDSEDWFDFTCEKCAKEYEIHVVNGTGGILFQIDENDDMNIYFLKVTKKVRIILSLINSHDNFKNEMEQLRNLIRHSIKGEHFDGESFHIPENEKALLFLFHSNAVAIMEAYFYNIFINNIKQHNKLLNRFLHLYYKPSKIEEQYKKFCDRDKLLEFVELTAGKRSFHNMIVVNQILQATFGVSVPEERSEIDEIVQKRHDIVHRNGYTKSREPLLLTSDDLNRSLEIIDSFVNNINKEIQSAKKKIICS